MGLVDTGDIIKVDFEDGDEFGNSYSDGWNRQRVYDAIGDETIMEKIPDTDIYILHNRALYIGTENPDTYFYDDDGGALIWRGETEESKVLSIEGYFKTDRLSYINSIEDGEWHGRFAQEIICDNFNIKGFRWTDVRGTIFTNYEIFDTQQVVLRDNVTLQNAIHRGDNLGNRKIGYWIRGERVEANNIQIINFELGINYDLVFYDGDVSTEGLIIEDCDVDIRYRLRENRKRKLTVINSRIDPESYTVYLFNVENSEITSNFQNRFQIYIENGSGASATLKDKDGNEIISGTLDSEGKWLLDDPVTWVQRYLETSDGELVEDQLNYFEPFSLEVKKNGLQDLAIPNIRSSIYDSEQDKRLGSLEDTVVEGQMRKFNYINSKIEGNINYQQVEGNIETKRVSGEIKSIKL